MADPIDPQTLKCKPIDKYSDIALFLQNPPVWRSLCTPLKPHSNLLIRNIELHKSDEVVLEEPQSFCHFTTDEGEPKRYQEQRLPKTLVCHDMANGYHDDSIIDGTEKYDAYTFYNWAGIDIFCYFSHHLITIPPLGWINVGHAHGVKVIGTLITEWAEGIQFWDHVLGSENVMQEAICSLVTIAKMLKFDGWLLNVENRVKKPALLLQFVQKLHQMLHAELPNAVLIWYDSVTVDGNLNWQNRLNEKNKAYFDACDGIFTNYSWKEEDIVASVRAAGKRLTDLYIGIDVWGRNFYGGGQFNTQEAVRLAHSYGCSLAIFAQAWTHEAMNEPAESTDKVGDKRIMLGEHLEDWQRFLLRDRALWGSLWPFLNTRTPSALPFQTSFCRGMGKKRRMYGEVVSPSTWYNLRHMQYQPNAAHGPHGYLLSTRGRIRALSQLAAPGQDCKLRQSLLEMCHDHRVIEDDVEDEHEELTARTEKRGKCARLREFINSMLRRKSRQTPSEYLQRSGHRASSGAETKEARSEWTLSEPSVHLNLSHSASSTRRLMVAWVAEERECLELFLQDSFSGGACLKINPSDQTQSDKRDIRLFFSDWHCEEAWVACVVTKTVAGFEAQTLDISLSGEQNGHSFRYNLVGHSVPQVRRVPNALSHAVSPIDHGSREFKELQKYLLFHQPGFYVPVENGFGWTVRYYVIEGRGFRALSVGVHPSCARGPVLLGHFALCERRASVAAALRSIMLEEEAAKSTSHTSKLHELD